MPCGRHEGTHSLRQAGAGKRNSDLLGESGYSEYPQGYSECPVGTREYSLRQAGKRNSDLFGEADALFAK